MPAVISKFNTTSYPVNYQTPQTRRGFRILGFGLELARNESEAGNARAKHLRMRKVSIFNIVVANAKFTTRTPFFELKSNFISIQNFKAGSVKPQGMYWSKDF